MKDSPQQDDSQNKQGTWRQAVVSFVLSALLVLAFRWIVFEPYVIPSGSLMPTLLELDYIYVNKFAYGLRVPFSNRWLFERSGPERCDVVVFRSQTEPGIFVIKRVIGLPGEKVDLYPDGRIRINGRPLATSLKDEGDEFQTLSEDCGNGTAHDIRVEISRQAIPLEADTDDSPEYSPEYSVVVPEGQYAMFGDNRHQSADSRVWGTLPRQDFLGEALGIWLSCEEGLPSLQRVCNPSTMRWHRIFNRLSRASDAAAETVSDKSSR